MQQNIPIMKKCFPSHLPIPLFGSSLPETAFEYTSTPLSLLPLPFLLLSQEQVRAHYTLFYTVLPPHNTTSVHKVLLWSFTLYATAWCSSSGNSVLSLGCSGGHPGKPGLLRMQTVLQEHPQVCLCTCVVRPQGTFRK